MINLKQFALSSLTTRTAMNVHSFRCTMDRARSTWRLWLGSSLHRSISWCHKNKVSILLSQSSRIRNLKKISMMMTKTQFQSMIQLSMLTWSLTLKSLSWIFNQSKTTWSKRRSRTSSQIKRWASAMWLLTTTKRTKSKSRVLPHLEEVPGLHPQQAISLLLTLIRSLMGRRHLWLRRRSVGIVREERSLSPRLREYLIRSTWKLKATCSKISATQVWTLRMSKIIKTTYNTCKCISLMRVCSKKTLSM